MFKKDQKYVHLVIEYKEISPTYFTANGSFSVRLTQFLAAPNAPACTINAYSFSVKLSSLLLYWQPQCF